MLETYSISAGKIHTGKGTIVNGTITVSDGKIESVKEQRESGPDFDLKDYIIVPSFSDIHTHGYFGVDSYFGQKDDIENWATKLYSTGVASFVPTLVSLPLDSIFEQFSKYRDIMGQQRDGATILGIRCEGPYLSREKRGAHNMEYLRRPELSELEELFRKGQGVLKIIDIAPEIGDFPAIVKLASKYGVKVSAGHSNATFKISSEAFDSGAAICTHFYNAMSTLTHDDAGMVGAGLLNDKVPLELIADFHHVPAESIRIIDRMRGYGKVVLITDSLSIGGSKGGKFSIGGLDIIEKGGVAWIKGTNTIAGSVLTMDMAVRNIKSLGLPTATIIHSTSSIQAEILGDVSRGFIEKGRKADIAILDRQLRVAALIHKGNVVFDKDNIFL